MKRMLPLFVLALLGSLFFDIRPTDAAKYCGTVGAYFKVPTSCMKGNACASGSVDILKMKSSVPEQYEYILNSLCGEGEVCCAEQGTELCAKVSGLVKKEGSCASSCGSGTREFTEAPELCANQLCCIPDGNANLITETTPSKSSFDLLRRSLSVTPAAYAAEAPPTPGYGLINPLGARSVPSLMADIVKLISGIAGTVFLVYLLWGGMQWMTAGGDSKKTLAARDRILYSILGIAIIFLAYFIVDALIGVTNVPF